MKITHTTPRLFRHRRYQRNRTIVLWFALLLAWFVLAWLTRPLIG